MRCANGHRATGPKKGSQYNRQTRSGRRYIAYHYEPPHLNCILTLQLQSGYQVLVCIQDSELQETYRRRGTYRTCLHPSCPRSRCRSHTASGRARSGCSCSGTGTARTSSPLMHHRETRTLSTSTAPPPLPLLYISIHRQVLTALFLGFIGSVSAVILPVALPACRDASPRVLAAELIHATCHLSCKKED